MKTIGKILETADDQIIKTGERFIDVTVGIFVDDEKEPRETRKLGYPVNTTKKAILADIKKVVAEYAGSASKADEQAEIDAENDQIEKLKADLEGEEIENDSKK